MAGKLRILCLPGWRTSSKFMQAQLQFSRFNDNLNKVVEFTPINPTFEALGPPQAGVYEVDPEGPYYEWFIFDETNPTVYKGLDQTVERLCSYLYTNGPFDGLLGFSQGGAVVHYLVQLALQGDKRIVNTFRFAVLVSAFPPRDEKFENDINHLRKLDFPTLHIYGTQDKIFKYCEIGVKLYKNPTVIVHTRAHAFPKCEGEVQQTVMKFMVEQQHNSTSTPSSPSHSKL